MNGGKKYRKMCGQLDQVDVVIFIHRINPKRFELHINGTIMKQYKQRRSCNRQISKIYKSKFENGNDN